MCILNIKCIWVSRYKYENNKTTQIFVQVIYITECEQNCVVNTEPAWKDQIIAILQAKSAISGILPGITEVPKYRIHINLNL